RSGLMRLGLVAVQCAIHPAVIVAFEFQDAGAPCVGTCQPVHQLYCFAAARGESNAFGARHHGLDLFRNGYLQFVLGSIADRLLYLATETIDHGGMVIAENHRSPGKLVVDVFVPVHIPQMCTLAVLEEEWNRRSRSEWAADSSSQRSSGPFQHLSRSLPVKRQVKVSY